MPHFGKEVIARLVAVSALLAGLPVIVWPQKYTKFDRDQAQIMLREVAADVRQHYYDPKLHGVDWDARVRQASENIDKADSMDAAVSEVAALLDSLNDSHTAFFLPPRSYIHKYGFKMKLIGDHCYITRVRSDSDAAKKGLKPGDVVVAMNEHPVTRNTLWRIEYIYNTLRPQPGLRLTLADETGHGRNLDVMAKIELSPVVKYGLQQGINQIVRDWEDEVSLLRPLYFEKGDALLAVRFPEFSFSAEGVDAILGRMRKHKGVILDLRGNPGGLASAVDRLLGGMFENDLKIWDRVGRDSTKPVSVSGRHHDAFTGRLVVLVDSGSASASELFARVIQVQKRGFVVGDRTSGKVMEAKSYFQEKLQHSGMYHGTQVTDADLIMTDGKSLEHVGVEPDIKVLPTSQDLASERDPAMSKAAGLLGVPISPEDAGSMFPYHESSRE